MSVKVSAETTVSLNSTPSTTDIATSIKPKYDIGSSYQKQKKSGEDNIQNSSNGNKSIPFGQTLNEETGQRANSFSRKRRWSCNFKDNAAFKRKRSHSCVMREEKISLPTKFLLGGSIADPLNLNGLTGQSLANMSPISSPWHPSPKSIDVVIPPNITDPLNLNSLDDNIGRRRKRHRHRKKDDSTTGTVNEVKVITPIGIDVSYELDPESQAKCMSAPIPSTSNTTMLSPQFTPPSRRRRRTMSECAADLVSAKELKFNKPRDYPAIIKSEDGCVPNNNVNNVSANQKKQKVKKKKPKFIHGNYNRYYGYRNPSDIQDIRLEFFDIEWFKDKDVLDIGCNVGHLTILVAKKLSPKKIVGIDIDSSLISAARKNIRYYVEAQEKQKPVFPVSNSVIFGPMEAPPLVTISSSESSNFPQNIVFKQGNYVLENEDQLSLVKEEYDTILALSISKWIHLNNGDEGIKMFFKRIHKHLRPGGRLILEPQPWASYKKRKNLTPNINFNFQNIKLKPEQFRDYLLAEVGFHKCEVIDVVNHKAKGFRRPIQVYTKFETSESATDPNKTPCSK